MALVTLTDVSKTYDANRPLLEQVSLTVRDSDKIGLIGPNGAGKSTLLRILAGVEVPDTGERTVRRGLRVGTLEQEPVLDGELSLRAIVRAGLEGRDELLAELDDVHHRLAAPDLEAEALERLLARQGRLDAALEAVGGHDVEHRVEATLHGVGIADPDVLARSLSGGEARRVALARLLVRVPDLMLLDEPTNHLDAFVVAWLEQRLVELRVPLVLVTHDRYLLDRAVDRIVEIDRGELYAYPENPERTGTYRHYLEQRAARLEIEARDERSRLLLLRRETEWMRAGVLARSTKAKARIARYEELADAAPTAREHELELAFPPGPRLGAKVVALRGVSHRYGDRVVLPPLDLEIESGMRLGVVGPNGAGKTTLLRILLGTLEPHAGRIEVGETVRFATVDQRRADLNPENTVVREVAGDVDHVTIAGRSIHVASFLERFLFPGARKETRIRRLSGGERGRVLLAKLMLRGGNVLVLDEPTNDLDLPTLRALEEALVAFEGTVVTVSHDRWFLDRVATHVLHLDGEGGVRLHTGSMSSLLERIAEEESERAETQQTKLARPKPAPPGATASDSSSKRLAPWERRELDELTGSIAELEEKIGALDESLADPALYAGDSRDARRLHDQRRTEQEALDAAMARWEELAARE